MAKVLSTGSTKNNRDSAGKRRGFKVFPSSYAQAGEIVLRQLGNKWYPGRNTTQGRDFTINATASGTLKSEVRSWKVGKVRRTRKYLHVVTNE